MNSDPLPSACTKRVAGSAILAMTACAIGLCCLLLPLQAAEEEQVWRRLPLISNRHIDENWCHVGWGGFAVDGDALRTECDPRGLGLLVYKKERLGNCQIRVVFKSKDAKSNAGVFVRLEEGILDQVTQPGAAFDRDANGKISAPSMKLMMTSAEREEGPWFAVHRGYEVQIMDAGDRFHRTGAIYSLAPSLADSDKHPDEWKTMIITLAGQRIQVDLDGRRITDFDPESPEVPRDRAWFEPKREPKRPEAGYIGLQNHDPGDVVWFREVSVRPLPAVGGAVGSQPGLDPSSDAHDRDAIAIKADEFLNSIGVCSAVSRRGENLDSTIQAARYLGVRWFRVGYESGIPVSDLIALHKETGVRFSYGLMSGGTDIARLLDGGRQLAAAGALLALEGNNEPNNWGVRYEGQRGGRTNSWLPVARLQRDLYRAVKSDPVLKEYPVWSLSENGAEVDNVGLQFLTIPNGAGTLMPDGTQYADYANCHNYMTHPSWRGLHDNQTWIAADPTRACRVDGLFGNYGVTWRHRYSGYSEPELRTLPRVTTETGITIGGEISEQVQALLYLSVFLDQFKRGWNHTAVYLLRDRTDERGNQTFGFYKPDYTPRLAATYLHNLTTILADTPSHAQPGKLNYSIPNQPATVHDLVLWKSGSFALVIWNERFTGGSDNITVRLGTPFPSAKLFDPTMGTSPIQRLTDAAFINLTLSNYPVIIEIPAL